MKNLPRGKNCLKLYPELVAQVIIKGIETR